MRGSPPWESHWAFSCGASTPHAASRAGPSPAPDPRWVCQARGCMQLYNSLTRRKEELPPPPGPIRMYVCGPTVYQRIHVGNARPYVVFQWLKRWLEARGYDVTLVENVTDVNDKI